jgi:ADP-ribosylglycohydrolase
MKLIDKIRGGIFGVAVGDAVGVPYEFIDRDSMKIRPAKDMISAGTHNQPLGTWSDDSSLTFCLMEGLIEGYDLRIIGQKFIDWFDKAYWTAHNNVFDIGATTRMAIHRLESGHTPEICGGFDEYSNGNGSLMRILPMVYFLKDEEDIEKRYHMVKDVSSMTHAHLRSVLACFIYIEYALLLLKGEEKFKAYKVMKQNVNAFISTQQFNPKEIGFYYDVLQEDVFQLNEDFIRGCGYVVNSLKASLWCFLNYNNYEEIVLKAVNLGEDTDTTAAITGGLAGLYYGFDNIPETWKFQLARYDDIEDLIERFNSSLEK